MKIVWPHEKQSNKFQLGKTLRYYCIQQWNEHCFIKVWYTLPISFYRFSIQRDFWDFLQIFHTGLYLQLYWNRTSAWVFSCKFHKNTYGGLPTDLICQRMPLKVYKFLCSMRSTKKRKKDTNNTIEWVIYVKFLHSNFARLLKNFYGKTFYEKKVTWNDESANKNHE